MISRTVCLLLLGIAVVHSFQHLPLNVRRAIKPLFNVPDDTRSKDEVNFFKGEKLGIEQLPVGEAPFDIYDSHWRFNCKLQAISSQIDYKYDFIIPIHLKMDKTLGTAKDDMIFEVSKWEILHIGGETYVDFGMYLVGMEGFLPNNVYNFNARVTTDDDGRISLVEGLIRTNLVIDFYDFEEAVQGTLSGAPYSEGMFAVGEFTVDPIDFNAIPSPKDPTMDM
mmetsp:Transcript_12240/g.15893  ORF Transcript_12240/g.15893 Transcript_12240/m.15893 type:complete len:223 (+) Transcript_12240:69-737(+)|eukprot:CAMPEP_0117877860 /NCGR_PEP_ID=MMETSP0950-20121206/14485_1 /TAXON_ID=44440 /ORGANISM="Chattonella subsalsa, Strain CCMP2191" /LENGTH=222 /DNA_ID=CAMNT_0005732015 /DNA_START=88 /DNA_END=756 /DNA_ORIENTATION=+